MLYFSLQLNYNMNKFNLNEVAGARNNDKS